MGMWDLPAKHEICDTELRFNPYHDPTNGRFTSGSGGAGGGYLYVGKGQKGKGAYVFERDIDAEYEQWQKSRISIPKALPEHFSENVNGYIVTDKELTTKSGIKVSHYGKYTEASPKEAALAKKNGINDPVIVSSNKGNAIVPRPVGEKVTALSQAASQNYKANLKNNVPGLDELKKVKSDYEKELFLHDKSILDGNGIIYKAKVTESDVEAVKAKYPTAVKYLTADAYASSSNYTKSNLGKEAKDKIRLGNDPDAVIKDMKSKWSKHTMDKAMFD